MSSLELQQVACYEHCEAVKCKYRIRKINKKWCYHSIEVFNKQLDDTDEGKALQKFCYEEFEKVFIGVENGLNIKDLHIPWIEPLLKFLKRIKEYSKQIILVKFLDNFGIPELIIDPQIPEIHKEINKTIQDIYTIYEKHVMEATD